MDRQMRGQTDSEPYLWWTGEWGMTGMWEENWLQNLKTDRKTNIYRAVAAKVNPVLMKTPM